ncbi:MAG: molybdopterin-guanine dinucleotide biosynthesis protein B [Desulfamplus sp.]|nr:molybdopterin-guanine dinucleotide biosynthesis protein B [Desulfamplus sp.]MBF0412736.1 molybdopterin-guanine dinucleotide biosynthesis protein B [Desulfamplus sp.]
MESKVINAADNIHQVQNVDCVKSPPPVISIISKKRSGKTTFIVKLIQTLKNRGYRVGTLKHDTHGFDIDHEGKDTYKHKQAGSDTVVISSPWKISVIKDVCVELTVDNIVASFFMDVDIVITEGYKKANKPQIEIFRSSAHQFPIYSKGETTPLVAMASDIKIDMDVPVYNINDVKGVADLIENRFLKK